VQLHISSHDGVPIYLQIVNQVKYLVASGRLEAGAELPPIEPAGAPPQTAQPAAADVPPSE